jgi:cell division protein FtsB
MWTRQYKKRKTGRLILPALSVAVLSYFGFHAWHGDYGLYAKYRVEAEIAAQKERLAALVKERQAAERRVQLLHDGTLDRDMLDEQIRRQLNYSSEKDVIVLRTAGIGD